MLVVVQSIACSLGTAQRVPSPGPIHHTAHTAAGSRQHTLGHDTLAPHSHWRCTQSVRTQPDTLQHQAALLLCRCLQLSLAAVQAVVQAAARLLRMLTAGVLVALALRAEVALLGLLLVELTPLVEGVAGIRCLAGVDLSHLRGLDRMATVGSRSAAPAAADTR